MGMAASQARLLSITARLTNNENTGQSISYSKQRLADQTQQITNEYNEALSATKLTVLTGFNGAEATYSDISYNLMTGLQMAENTKQYIVTDTKGRILVTEELADAYKKSSGNYNQFLTNLGYSQSDMKVQNTATLSAEEKENAAQKIHEAWDKYFATIGINLGDIEHDGFLEEFKWNNTWSTNEQGQYLDKNGNVINTEGMTADEIAAILEEKGYSFVGSGYASSIQFERNDDGSIKYEQAVDEDGTLIYEKQNEDGEYDTNSNPVYDYSKPIIKKDQNGNPIYAPINYEGTTQESRELYDYAMAITEAFMRTEESLTDEQKGHNEYYDLSEYKSAANNENTSALNYYKNIFTKMQSCGYFTYTTTAADAARDPEHYIYASIGTGTAGNVQKSPLKDNVTFENALRDGTLRLEYYSTTDKGFVSTTISEDNCIQEVADERAIAAAESKYNQDMNDLENKDKKLDLELKKLDTEHSALQTEYDSVKNVVDKNVEASFKTFG